MSHFLGLKATLLCQLRRSLLGLPKAKRSKLGWTGHKDSQFRSSYWTYRRFLSSLAMCSIKERLFTSKERVKTAAPKAGNNAHLSARWQRWINLLGQKSQMYNICNTYVTWDWKHRKPSNPSQFGQGAKAANTLPVLWRSRCSPSHGRLNRDPKRFHNCPIAETYQFSEETSEMHTTARAVRYGKALVESWANCDQASAVAMTQPALATLPQNLWNC